MASVDFLGNPMGLINDVSSGLEGLVKRGNVGGLFRNVAHGVSDSAAKVSLTSCSVSNPSKSNIPQPQILDMKLLAVSIPRLTYPLFALVGLYFDLGNVLRI